MNEDFKRLEAELAAMQPQPPSPELQQRIAERLALPEEPGVGADQRGAEQLQSVINREIRGRTPSRRGFRVLLAAAAIAACILLTLGLLSLRLWPRGDDYRPVAVPPPAPAAPLDSAFDPSLPSLWQYRLAAAQSADALDDLLDQHAGRTEHQTTQFVQIRGFGRIDSDFPNPTGEL